MGRWNPPGSILLAPLHIAGRKDLLLHILLILLVLSLLDPALQNSHPSSNLSSSTTTWENERTFFLCVADPNQNNSDLDKGHYGNWDPEPVPTENQNLKDLKTARHKQFKLRPAVRTIAEVGKQIFFLSHYCCSRNSKSPVPSRYFSIFESITRHRAFRAYMIYQLEFTSPPPPPPF